MQDITEIVLELYKQGYSLKKYIQSGKKRLYAVETVLVKRKGDRFNVFWALFKLHISQVLYNTVNY